MVFYSCEWKSHTVGLNELAVQYFQLGNDEAALNVLSS